MLTLLLHLTLSLSIDRREDAISIAAISFALFRSLLQRMNLFRVVLLPRAPLVEEDLALLRSVLVDSVIIFHKFAIACVCMSLVVGIKFDFRSFAFKSNHGLRPQRDFTFRDNLVCIEQLAFHNIEPFADVKVLVFHAFAPIGVVGRQLQVGTHVGVDVPVDDQVVVDVKLDPARLRVFSLFFLLVERVLHHARVEVVRVRVQRRELLLGAIQLIILVERRPVVARDLPVVESKFVWEAIAVRDHRVRFDVLVSGCLKGLIGKHV